jgi:hypothetical protein
MRWRGSDGGQDGARRAHDRPYPTSTRAGSDSCFALEALNDMCVTFRAVAITEGNAR